MGEFSPSDLRVLRSIRRFIDEQFVQVGGSNRSNPPMGRNLQHSALTDREREVAALAATGATNAEIARMLVVSMATIKTHLYRAFSKLDIRNRAELAHRLANAEMKSDGMPQSATTDGIADA